MDSMELRFLCCDFAPLNCLCRHNPNTYALYYTASATFYHIQMVQKKSQAFRTGNKRHTATIDTASVTAAVKQHTTAVREQQQRQLKALIHTLSFSFKRISRNSSNVVLNLFYLWSFAIRTAKFFFLFIYFLFE